MSLPLVKCGRYTFLVNTQSTAALWPLTPMALQQKKKHPYKNSNCNKTIHTQYPEIE